MSTTFTRRCIVDWGATGATVTATVYDGSNTSKATGSGTEHPSGSGLYYLDVTWDNSWTSPRVVWTDGTDYAVETAAVANTTQISGTATALGTLTGSQSVTVQGTSISVTDA